MHMNRIRIHIFFLIVILAGGIQAQNPRSVFTDRPGDSAAVYFTPEYFPIKPDGSTDVSDALQEALNTAKHKESGCGILFVPKEFINLVKRYIYLQGYVSLDMGPNVRYSSLVKIHPASRK